MVQLEPIIFALQQLFSALAKKGAVVTASSSPPPDPEVPRQQRFSFALCLTLPSHDSHTFQSKPQRPFHRVWEEPEILLRSGGAGK